MSVDALHASGPTRLFASREWDSQKYVDPKRHDVDYAEAVILRKIF
jgi:hypothetical protein